MAVRAVGPFQEGGKGVVSGSFGPLTGALAGGGGLFCRVCGVRRLLARVVLGVRLTVSVWRAAVLWCSVPMAVFPSVVGRDLG